MRPHVEQLEARNCCSVCLDIPSPCDRNDDGIVSLGDTLAIVNAIQAGQNRDVNGDGATTPQDILIVLNWVVDHQPPSAGRMYTVTIRDSDTVGVEDYQVRQAIFAATEEFSRIADVGFRFVRSGGQLAVTTYEIYVGNGLHGRGIYLGNGVIGLHDGIIAPYHHSGRNGPVNQTLYYQVFANQQAVQQVFGHEMLHWMGLTQHSADTSCRLHSNSPPGFCAAEIAWLRSTFGPSKRIG